jgi:hypothetical protein
LYPAGHFGFVPVTFFVVLPLIHVIVFSDTTLVPVSKIFTVTEIGVKVVVPAAVAATEQFPAPINLRVEPVIEQIPAEVVENVTAPLPEAVAVKSKILLFTSTL